MPDYHLSMATRSIAMPIQHIDSLGVSPDDPIALSSSDLAAALDRLAAHLPPDGAALVREAAERIREQPDD